jgi:hypothetical protein
MVAEGEINVVLATLISAWTVSFGYNYTDISKVAILCGCD